MLVDNRGVHDSWLSWGQSDSSLTTAVPRTLRGPPKGRGRTQIDL
jgi:hypothetical protein